MRGKFAAKPGQIESCIDPPNEVIVRHRVCEVKLREKLTRFALQTAHHDLAEIRVSTTESRFEGYLNRLLQQNPPEADVLLVEQFDRAVGTSLLRF